MAGGSNSRECIAACGHYAQSTGDADFAPTLGDGSEYFGGIVYWGKLYSVGSEYTDFAGAANFGGRGHGYCDFAIRYTTVWAAAISADLGADCTVANVP